LAAVEIVDFSSLDKVAVSRAVTSMRKKGYLIKSVDGDDRRRSALKLSAKGREVYFDLVPQMMALEKDMFAGFTPQERADFQDMMLRIQQNIQNREQD
jgi:DNA-binding MarR family transcriptional regulator